MARPKKTATAKKTARRTPKKAAVAKTMRKKAVAKTSKAPLNLQALLRNLLQDVEKQISVSAKGAGKEADQLKKRLAKALSKQKAAKAKKAAASAKAASKRTVAAKAQLKRAQAEYTDCRNEVTALQTEFDTQKAAQKSAKQADKQLADLAKLIAKFEKTQDTKEKSVKKTRKTKTTSITVADGVKKKRGRPAGSKNKMTLAKTKKKPSFADNIAESLNMPIEESAVARDDIDSFIDTEEETRVESVEY